MNQGPAVNTPVRPAALLAAVVLAAACERAPAGPVELRRSGRLGPLRDLVLFERAPALGGPFFLDRFECTRADWAEYLAATGQAPVAVGADDAALPHSGMDLDQARAYARWRFCRLPRLDEWLHAATIGGTSPFPWGTGADGAKANTAELGLGEPTRCGTFESGRREGEPYDLIGNVAEWTESISANWFQDRSISPAFGDRLPALLGAGLRRARKLPALGVWLLIAQPWPETWLAEASGGATRDVVGSDFGRPMTAPPLARTATDRASTIGLRLATSPRDLLLALWTAAGPVEPDTDVRLQRLLRSPRHRQALLDAWPAAVRRLRQVAVATGPYAARLAVILGQPLPESSR
ncbi:MAG: SUMF1/EgtB/PvdO family nonheme iron enzyme [Planctomycetes bacterium]|nr:SUMF1/EgtB/PvdO family nonheme iron enzyme [Planctomycetota bacterium]